MSTGNRYPFALAHATAEMFLANIRPWCERVQIAGSLRRLDSAGDVPEDATVGDIEVVCLPGSLNELLTRLLIVVDETLKGSGQRMRKLMIPVPWELQTEDAPQSIKCDLFIARREPARDDIDLFSARELSELVSNWGYILMLRTGSSDFSKEMVKRRDWGGLKPPHLTVDDGMVSRGGIRENLPDEATLFRLWGLPYLEPHERTSATVQQLRQLAA